MATAAKPTLTKVEGTHNRNLRRNSQIHPSSELFLTFIRKIGTFGHTGNSRFIARVQRQKGCNYSLLPVWAKLSPLITNSIYPPPPNGIMGTTGKTFQAEEAPFFSSA
jgi:hypothetical protein